jgi:Methyltransferase domain
MTTAPRSVRFPSVAFASHAEFEAYRHANREALDSRYLYEVSLATTEAAVRRQGVCAPCLRACIFDSPAAGGEARSDGRIVPDWQNLQTCDCEDRLSQRSRALLHFAGYTRSLHPWTRLLLFGRQHEAERRLGQQVRSMTRIARMQLGPAGADGQPSYQIAADDQAFHAAISVHYLQHVPPLEPALRELHRVLVPGGRLIFTVPLRVMAERSVANTDHLPPVQGALPVETEGEAHTIGWDIIDRLHDAGFDDVHAHAYWSDELGYLGPFKMIFVAVR